MKIKPGLNAIITGASRGLGTYIARTLAKNGVNLVLAARSQSAIESLRDELIADGIKAVAVPTDMSKKEDIQYLYRRSVEEFSQIDLLINNAGIEATSDYRDLTFDEIQEMIDVNLTGPMLLCHLAIPDMYSRDKGHIVNIASAAGIFPSPFCEPYSTTKAGLIGFTDSLRLSAQVTKSNVSASVIAPGYMDDAGMYENVKEFGVKPPWFIGSLPAQDLADDVIKCIERNTSMSILMPGIPRFLKIMHLLIPRTFERFLISTGTFGPLIASAERKRLLP